MRIYIWGHSSIVYLTYYIIIIIIKKVKIIVTLSIKNTAGALYKSQIKGENRIKRYYCDIIYL